MMDGTQPDPENVCPGCGGYVDHDEYKCDKCSGSTPAYWNND